jgi:hypothetical protein
MKLAAISGVHGVYSDADIKKVVARALKERARIEKGEKRPPAKVEEKKETAAPKKPPMKAPSAKKLSLKAKSAALSKKAAAKA